eukprot:2560490-Ditylum_brightwellii.AAC.1
MALGQRGKMMQTVTQVNLQGCSRGCESVSQKRQKQKHRDWEEEGAEFYDREMIHGQHYAQDDDK